MAARMHTHFKARYLIVLLSAICLFFLVTIFGMFNVQNPRKDLMVGNINRGLLENSYVDHDDELEYDDNYENKRMQYLEDIPSRDYEKVFNELKMSQAKNEVPVAIVDQHQEGKLLIFVSILPVYNYKEWFLVRAETDFHLSINTCEELKSFSSVINDTRFFYKKPVYKKATCRISKN